MTERLGFNDTLLLLAVAGIGAFALGALLGTGTASSPSGIAGYIEQTDKGSRDAVRNLQVTGNLLQDLGVVAAGTAVILAAIRAEGHSTAIRAIMLILGVVIIFQMLTFGFSAGFGR
jgi:hypothetical protein